MCAVFLLSNVATVSATTGCLSFSSDLGYGMTDASTGGPVALLQQYLASVGYLAVAANGHFGPATVAAVESFQAANGISATGRVGPLTRAALGRITCAGSSGGVQAAQPLQTAVQAQTIPTIIQPVNPAAAASVITAPQAGQTLTTGQSFDIVWNSPLYSRYDLVLVSPNGAGAGFIASSVTNANSYLWTVGSVFSSQTQSNIIVPVGSYQIRIQNSATGAEPNDPISNPFTIAAATLGISSVFPASVPANGNTAAVLYGSNLNSSVSVTFSGTGAKGQVLYVSPDGKVLVFSVPNGTPAGSQAVYVTNQSGQSSNQLSFTIIAP